MSKLHRTTTTTTTPTTLAPTVTTEPTATPTTTTTTTTTSALSLLAQYKADMATWLASDMASPQPEKPDLAAAMANDLYTAALAQYKTDMTAWLASDMASPQPPMPVRPGTASAVVEKPAKGKRNGLRDNTPCAFTKITGLGKFGDRANWGAVQPLPGATATHSWAQHCTLAHMHETGCTPTEALVWHNEQYPHLAGVFGINWRWLVARYGLETA